MGVALDAEKRSGQGEKDLGAKERKHAGGKESNEDKSAQNGTCDSFAHMPAMHGRRFARCFCLDSGNIAQQYFSHNKKEPCDRVRIGFTFALLI